VNGLVVYESMYGNTRAIAHAIAETLGSKAVMVQEAPADVADIDLLVVGGPTHIHTLSTTRSRQAAVAAAMEDGGSAVDEHAADEPGLRAWLRDLSPSQGTRAAAFDTRLDRSPWLTGLASRAISKRLARRGYDVVSTESFLVQDSEGPLEDGELERARVWSAGLAQTLAEKPRRAGMSA
jgi:hypothetical protein